MRFKTDTVVVPIAVLIVAMVCFQVGTALAKGLFPAVGAGGTAALRLALSSLMLLAVWRPWRMRLSRREIRVIAYYGLALGFMNFFSTSRCSPFRSVSRSPWNSRGRSHWQWRHRAAQWISYGY